MRIVWTDLALDSLDEIAAYIERNFSTAIAKQSLAKIFKSTDILTCTPEIGMSMPDFAEFGNVRYLHYKQNLIIYRIKNGLIQIIIVWDGRRGYETMLDLILDFFSKEN